MLRLGAICVFGFTVGDDIGIPLLAIFPDTPFCLKVNIDDSEAPFEVIHERPEVVSLNVSSLQRSSQRRLRGAGGRKR